MTYDFFGGLDFGTSGARISIINSRKELIFSNSVHYSCAFNNPKSWSDSCEKLIESLPLNIKNNIVRLSISGTSGTLLACNLKGDPLGEAIPYNKACNNNEILIELLTTGEDHLQTPYSSLAKALKLINKYGVNIILRHQSDWITGWFLKDWRYGEE